MFPIKYNSTQFCAVYGRPTGVVDRGADCCTKCTGFESRVRHGCKKLSVPSYGVTVTAYQVLP